jgi:hypothetical protein
MIHFSNTLSLLCLVGRRGGPQNPLRLPNFQGVLWARLYAAHPA